MLFPRRFNSVGFDRMAFASAVILFDNHFVIGLHSSERRIEALESDANRVQQSNGYQCVISVMNTL